MYDVRKYSKRRIVVEVVAELVSRESRVVIVAICAFMFSRHHTTFRRYSCISREFIVSLRSSRLPGNYATPFEMCCWSDGDVASDEVPAR